MVLTLEKFTIFLTVGTQLKFDRLIKYAEEIVDEDTNLEIFFQLGAGSYIPSVGEYCFSMPEEDFQKRIDSCDLVVAHAGIGSIVSALSNGKPLIVVPREVTFGEHRNNHQVDTTSRLNSDIKVARTKDELKSLIHGFKTGKTVDRGTGLAPDKSFCEKLDVIISNLL